MPLSRLPLLLSSLAVVPAALVLATAGPAGAAPAGSGFGAHVSSCAQASTGFSGGHNPSHHRGPSGWHVGTGC